MSRIKSVAITTLILMIGSLSGCGSTNESSTGSSASTSESVTTPKTVKSCNQEIVLNSTPQKVVSLGVTGLAYLVAAGAEQHIIARANEFDEPPAAWIGTRADNIKVLSGDLSLEGLVGLDPDLAYGGGFSPTNLTPTQVTEKKIPAVVDNPECHYFYPDVPENESFDNILSEITELGQLLNTSSEADKTVQELKDQIDTIKKENLGQGRSVSYAYYFGEDTELFSYGQKGVMGEINDTLGIHSAIDPNYHPHQGPIAPEAFVKSDPDMIVILEGMGGATKESTLDRLKEIPGYSEMKAVKNNQIFFIESAAAYASPGAIYGMIELADQIKKN
ncbi:ABC transporter substrate-binding protein [Stomatohabitans albus]|uniref:ABC transporter substrate-binding protein n=1 Tax=Stomatohabitans albus TaxID=3110766 RepID=UPI00300C603E